jgi:TfoX/Sxy family transcriptional regulator of competence genes
MNLVDIHLRKQVENRYAGNNQDEPHDGSQIRHLEERGAGGFCDNGEDEEYVVERRENIQIVFLYCEKSGEESMPSSEKFRDHVLQQFMGELRVTTRKMMGEYILYADGKIFGGIYDDRLLVKPVPAALAMLPGAKKQLPYDGAKPMLRVTNEQIEDSEFLAKLLDAMLPELPDPKAKKK